MAAVRGMLTAVLGLVALETIVSTKGAADRTGGLLSDTADLIDRIFDPTVPAIADRSGTLDDGATAKTTAKPATSSGSGDNTYTGPIIPTRVVPGHRAHKG